MTWLPSSAYSTLSQKCLELGEYLLDRVEVGVGERKEEQLGASRFDGVARRIVVGSTLPFRRYCPVIVETDDEWHEWEAFIADERDRPVVPICWTGDRRGNRR
ncbi:hypothetical protein QE363_000067 [Sphingomonas sp. SORGH_AS870]|nr:hypothetical protein [Sphingomonas sp. SORGH_AS_0870]